VLVSIAVLSWGADTKPDFAAAAILYKFLRARGENTRTQSLVNTTHECLMIDTEDSSLLHLERHLIAF